MFATLFCVTVQQVLLRKRNIEQEVSCGFGGQATFIWVYLYQGAEEKEGMKGR